MRSIDINVDAGEGYGAWTLGDDRALFRIATSANLACGFHAGDPATIARAVEEAVAAGIAIGAHPGLPDRVGFGRRFLAVAPRQIRDDAVYQLGALGAFVRAAGSRLHHVKAHGALATHVTEQSDEHAAAFLEAVRLYDPALPLIAIAGSRLAVLAGTSGHPVVREAFPDRAYRADGTLVPRSADGAVVADPAAIAARAVSLATAGEVAALDGSTVGVAAETLTIHGDHPGSVEAARRVRAALEAAGVVVQAF